MVQEVDAPGGGRTRTLGIPLLFNGKSQLADSAAPRVGEHTQSILGEFGFSGDEIAALIDSKVVFQAN